MGGIVLITFYKNLPLPRLYYDEMKRLLFIIVDETRGVTSKSSRVMIRRIAATRSNLFHSRLSPTFGWTTFGGHLLLKSAKMFG